MAEHADGQIGALGQPVGEHAQSDAFAGAGVAVDQGEAALAHLGLLDAPAEVLQLRCDEQRFGGEFRREGIPLQAIQSQQLMIHSDSWGK